MNDHTIGMSQTCWSLITASKRALTQAHRSEHERPAKPLRSSLDPYIPRSVTVKSPSDRRCGVCDVKRRIEGSGSSVLLRSSCRSWLAKMFRPACPTLLFIYANGSQLRCSATSQLSECTIRICSAYNVKSLRSDVDWNQRRGAAF